MSALPPRADIVQVIPVANSCERGHGSLAGLSVPARGSRRTCQGVAGPVWRARKWMGPAPAAFRPYRRPALIERRIAAVLAAVPRVDRAPASAGPRRLAPLRARPALGVSVGEQQSHYCDTQQNKTDRAHGSSPSPSFRAANAKGEVRSSLTLGLADGTAPGFPRGEISTPMRRIRSAG